MLVRLRRGDGDRLFLPARPRQDRRVPRLSPSSTAACPASWYVTDTDRGARTPYARWTGGVLGVKRGAEGIMTTDTTETNGFRRRRRIEQRRSDGLRGQALAGWPTRCGAAWTPPSTSTFVLGLIFLKYISDAFQELHGWLESKTADGYNPEDMDEYRGENIFWVPPEARWPHLKAQARQSTIGQLVDDAMTRH